MKKNNGRNGGMNWLDFGKLVLRLAYLRGLASGLQESGRR